MRKYEPIWTRLKQTGLIKVEVTGFKSSNIVRDIKTIVRGVQKEKYEDVKFRIHNPAAELSHTVEDLPTLDIDNNNPVTVYIEFKLNKIPSLEDFV